MLPYLQTYEIHPLAPSGLDQMFCAICGKWLVLLVVIPPLKTTTRTT